MEDRALIQTAQTLGRLLATESIHSDDFDVLQALAEGYASATDGNNLSAQLEILNSLQSVSRELIEWRVADARKAGQSWATIGSALSMTKQGAQQKFGHAG